MGRGVGARIHLHDRGLLGAGDRGAARGEAADGQTSRLRRRARRWRLLLARLLLLILTPALAHQSSRCLRGSGLLARPADAPLELGERRALLRARAVRDRRGAHRRQHALQLAEHGEHHVVRIRSVGDLEVRAILLGLVWIEPEVAHE